MPQGSQEIATHMHALVLITLLNEICTFSFNRRLNLNFRGYVATQLCGLCGYMATRLRGYVAMRLRSYIAT